MNKRSIAIGSGVLVAAAVMATGYMVYQKVEDHATDYNMSVSVATGKPISTYDMLFNTKAYQNSNSKLQKIIVSENKKESKSDKVYSAQKLDEIKSKITLAQKHATDFNNTNGEINKLKNDRNAVTAAYKQSDIDTQSDQVSSFSSDLKTIYNNATDSNKYNFAYLESLSNQADTVSSSIDKNLAFIQDTKNKAKSAYDSIIAQEQAQAAAAAAAAQAQANAQSQSAGSSRTRYGSGTYTRSSGSGYSRTYARSGYSSGSGTPSYSVGTSCRLGDTSATCQGAVNGAARNQVTDTYDGNNTHFYAIHDNYGGSATYGKNSVVIGGKTYNLGAPIQTDVSPGDGGTYFQTCQNGKIYIRRMS